MITQKEVDKIRAKCRMDIYGSAAPAPIVKPQTKEKKMALHPSSHRPRKRAAKKKKASKKKKRSKKKK